MPSPPTNPFTPDQPIVEEERFFGRGEAIEWIDDRIIEGHHIILIFGMPHVGKTSLLYRLRPRYAGKVLPVYVGVAHWPQAPVRDLLWRLAVEIHQQLNQGQLDSAELSREAFLAQWDYLHQEAFPAWRQILQGKHLLLLLDGLDLARLEEGTWAELLLRLQEIVAQESDLWIVATVNGASTQIKSPVPALRGVPLLDLDFLTEPQTEELLNLAHLQLGFDYDAVRRIHKLTGGHPYLVQRFGAELYRRLVPSGQVTIHIVNDLAPLIAAATAEDLFNQQWEALSRGARIVLAGVAGLQGYQGTITAWDVVLLLRKSGVERPAAVIEQSLNELCNHRIMRWLSGSVYTLRMDLWRTWLAEAHPLVEVLTGKRPRPKEALPVPKRRIAIDWGSVSLWVAVGLVVLIVGRVWATRGSHPEVIELEPTPTLVRTPLPVATRVVLPSHIVYMAQAGPHEPWCIWTMHDDGTDPVRLTDATSEDTMPAWSPDGKRLAFVSNRGGNRDVWLMNTDGGQLENITRSEADEWTPAWSPDGTAIAFSSYRDGNWEIYLCKPDGTQVQPLTRNAAADYAPAWSSDGGRIAFVSERDGNPEIYIVNRDGTGLRRLTEDAAKDQFPQWSPDGSQIAFESERDGNAEVYVMAQDGSGVRNLTNEPSSDEHGPSWSPDGKRISYYSNRDGSWDIFIVLADGQQKVNLTQSPEIVEQGSAWQPMAR